MSRLSVKGCITSRFSVCHRMWRFSVKGRRMSRFDVEGRRMTRFSVWRGAECRDLASEGAHNFEIKRVNGRRKSKFSVKGRRKSRFSV